MAGGRPDRRRAVDLLLLVLGLALAGAFAFGLWHVVVGGLLHGNPRAGMFGAVLATLAGLALLAGARWRLGGGRHRAGR